MLAFRQTALGSLRIGIRFVHFHGIEFRLGFIAVTNNSFLWFVLDLDLKLSFQLAFDEIAESGAT